MWRNDAHKYSGDKPERCASDNEQQRLPRRQSDTIGLAINHKRHPSAGRMLSNKM